MTPILTINGTPVKCALNRQAQPEPDPIGDAFARSFSGRARRSVRGYVRTFQLVTSVLSLEEAHGLMLALSSPYPLRCSGWLFGGLETECFGRVTAFHPRTYAHGDGGVVEFQLQDAEPYQPILYWLRADRALPAGMTFSRTSGATLTDRTGILREVGPDVPRIEWLDLDGDGVRETPVLVQESMRTGKAVHTYLYGTNGTAGWTLSGDAAATLTVADDAAKLAAAGLGAVVADGAVLKLDDSAGGATAWAANAGTVLGDTSAHTLSAFMRGTGTARLILTGQDGNSTDIALTDSYIRYTQTVTPTAGTRALQVRANPGAVVYFVLPQLNVGTFATSVYPNSTAFAVTRATDLIYADFHHRPQAMAIYARFIERGTIAAGVTRRLWWLGGTAGVGARLYCTVGGGNEYLLVHNNGTGYIQSSAPSGVQYGDLVEVLSILYPDGSVRQFQSRNGGPVGSGTQSAANPLASSWGEARLYLGSRNGNEPGFTAFRDLMVLRGSGWTLDQVRRLVR